MNTSPSDSKRYPALEHILPRDIDERKNIIHEELNKADDDSKTTRPPPSMPINWKGSSNNRFIIKIPLLLPLYNMNNGRLFADQNQYLASENKNENRNDFFHKKQEDADTQKKAHKWLIEYAKDSKKNIFELVRKKDAQEFKNPISITPAGICIDGNRRLASFRDVYYSDPDKYDLYSEIHCIVLPTGNRQDYSNYQAQIQEVPDVTLGYSWVDNFLRKWESINVEKLTIEQAAKRYKVKKADIELNIFLKEEADIYLKENNKKGMYKDLAQSDTLQIFMDATKNMFKYKKNDIDLKRKARTILHHCLNAKLNKNVGKDAVLGRMYNYVGTATSSKLIREVFDKYKNIYIKTDSPKDLMKKLSSLNDKEIVQSIKNIDIVNKNVKANEEGKKRKTFFFDRVDVFLGDLKNPAVSSSMFMDSDNEQLPSLKQKIIKIRSLLKETIEKIDKRITRVGKKK